MDVPIIIKLLFLEEFNVTKMVEKYESMVRDMSIRSYCRDLSVRDKTYYIKEMLDSYASDSIMRFQIHSEFPVCAFVKTFGPFLEKSEGTKL